MGLSLNKTQAQISQVRNVKAKFPVVEVQVKKSRKCFKYNKIVQYTSSYRCKVQSLKKSKYKSNGKCRLYII